MGKQPRTERVLVGLGLVALCALRAGAAQGLSNPNDFCTGDPCIISSDKVVTAGAVIDFGTRSVVLQRTLDIQALPGGNIGSFTLKAGNFSITGVGQIKGNASAHSAGSATIQVVNNIQLNGTAANGTVRFPGQDGGVLNLITTVGSVSATGRINLSGDGIIASGGTLSITSAGNVTLNGDLMLPGGAQGAGGSIDISAGGNVTTTGIIDLTGGEAGAGFLDVIASGNVSLGETDMSANGDAGDAGLATFDIGGSFTQTARFRGRGADNGENCGDGADVDVTALGNITLNGEMDIRGRGLDCAGGFLALDGESVFLQGQLLMSGTGTEGEGGDLDVSARTLISLTGTVQIDGGDSGAGDVLFLSEGNIDLGGVINAFGRSSISPGSSLIEIDSGAILTVTGDINASGGSLAPGGDVTLAACDVIVQATSDIVSLGDLGAITIEGSDKVILSGRFTASSNGGNDIEFGPRANPPTVAGAVFSPAATFILNPALVACRICETNADCTDMNACTDDTCSNGTACLHAPHVGSCSDGNACTIGDTCSAGTCVGGAVTTCNDNNVCTTDSCVPATGCVNTPFVGACDDGNLCTTGDSCATGSCVGAPINCGDGNPCTNDVCTAGACSNPPNSAPCSDGNACTIGDTCSASACQPGAPATCNDSNVCTTDSCSPAMGCQSVPIPGCADTDGDGKLDAADECTTVNWTAQPTTPPNQHPLKLGVKATKLTRADGEQTMLLKGLFNVATPAPLLNPAVNGLHIYVADSGGALFDLSLPGGNGCIPGDGWTSAGTAWKYRNKSGALPPGCAPGSARGIASVLIKDARLAAKSALQFKIKAKNATLLRDPNAPLTRVQLSVALAAQPSPGVASTQARIGQCAEAVLTGNPIASAGPKPFCKTKLVGAAIDAASCKGR